MLTYNGTTPQSVWPWLGLYPGQDLAYQGTAFVCAASYDLGSTASIGNHNFEIVGPLAGTGVNGNRRRSVYIGNSSSSFWHSVTNSTFLGYSLPALVTYLTGGSVDFSNNYCDAQPGRFSRNQRLFRVWLIALSQACLNVVSSPC